MDVCLIVSKPSSAQSCYAVFRAFPDSVGVDTSIAKQPRYIFLELTAVLVRS